MSKGVMAWGVLLILMIVTSICAALVSADCLPETTSAAPRGISANGLAHAELSIHRNLNVHSVNDSIMSGTYAAYLGYYLEIYNEDDDSDTVLSNLSFNIQQKDLITGLDWRAYASWNESSAEWNFPPEFVIEEHENFGTGLGTSYSEPKYVNLNLNRWFNQTQFNETGYQLVNFTVEFEDKDFEWLWGFVGAHEHEEVFASIVPGTFATNAPLDWIGEEEHGVHFDFNKTDLQSGVSYNFSVVIAVAPERPVIYKPEITIGEGLYSNFTTGDTGYTADMPAYMLPENVSCASGSTNVPNLWSFERVNHLIAGLGEVVELAGPYAELHFNQDFHIWVENDTITSGSYESSKWYGLHLENVEDASGTVLGDLKLSVKADNITDLDWKRFANWNESSADWDFPLSPRYTVEEAAGFDTWFTRSGTELRAVNLSASRWLNITEFNGSDYQLALFTVTFEDTNFEWVWARIEALDHPEIRASIVPCTFTFNAPVNDFNEWDHGVHVNFDKDQIEPGVPYNFSVLIQVEPTGTAAPPILYKPRFSVGEGLYYNETTGAGYKIEIPPEMLPENVSYVAASTNVSNAWLIKRHNHVIAGLEEVVELPGPHAVFSVDKNFIVMTKTDSIQSGTYKRNRRYGLSILNSDDTSDTILGDLRFHVQGDNITDVRWEEYAVWNKTAVSWTFPADVVINEDEWFSNGFGTSDTEVRYLPVDVLRQLNQPLFTEDAYQITNFTITFANTNFQVCGGRIEANDHDEVNASIVPGTFTTTAPLEWIIEWEHGVDFSFNSAAIQIGVPYNCSVVVDVDLQDDVALPLVYKPLFQVNIELEQSFAPGDDGFTIEMPPEKLPNYVYNASATTNVSNTWMRRQVNRTLVLLEEVYEPPILDTEPSESSYPSISGIHKGTIATTYDIPVSKLYTYFCPGTGGHTEYAAISCSNGTVIAEAYWSGYTGDWHNITFNNSFTLYANQTYNYTLRTGSYPQIIHASSHNAIGGVITCTEFVDVNGQKHEGWIPAIRLS